MGRDDFISITDLRQNATKCLKGLSKTNEKIVFINNKPRAVLVDFDKYELMKQAMYTEVGTLPDNEITIDMRNQAQQTKDMDESEFTNIK